MTGNERLLWATIYPFELRDALARLTAIDHRKAKQCSDDNDPYVEVNMLEALQKTRRKRAAVLAAEQTQICVTELRMVAVSGEPGNAAETFFGHMTSPYR